MSTPYTKKELDEIIRYCLWKEPRRRLNRSKFFDSQEQDHTPSLPNWALLSKRNQWVTTFHGITLVVAKELLGQRWCLYLGGEIKLGEPGSCQEMKERGTALLVTAMLSAQIAAEKEAAGPIARSPSGNRRTV